jgi:hypothetical protein
MPTFWFSMHGAGDVAQRLRLALMMLLVGVAGCSGLSVRTDYDHDAAFSRYRTYSWIGPNPLLAAPGRASPDAEERIQRAVRATLQEKGFRFVADAAAADLLIAFTLGQRDPFRVDTSLDTLGLTSTARWAFRYYSGVHAKDYRADRLALDVFDAATRRPVWHGYALKSLTRADRKDPDALVRRAVGAILATFPPNPPVELDQPPVEEN